MAVSGRNVSWASLACGAAVLLALLVIYLATPLFGDQQASIAAAHQADFDGSFPGNVVESWDMRGLFYKFTVYFFYRSALLAADYGDKESFELAVRTVAAATALALLALGTLASRKFLERRRIAPLEAFFLFAIAILTLAHRCAFEAEDIACWVCILGTACALSDSRWAQAAGGLVLSSAVEFKGITVVMGVLGCAAVLAVGTRRPAAAVDRRPFVRSGNRRARGEPVPFGALGNHRPQECHPL